MLEPTPRSDDTGNTTGWGAHLADPSACPDGPHRGPQGPNEDLAQCPRCMAPSYGRRNSTEQYGLHLKDCSLPRLHGGRCVGGGDGHAPASLVRGFWPGMDADVARARAEHAQDGAL